MAQKTVFICDWCGATKEQQHYGYSFPKVDYGAVRRKLERGNSAMEVCPHCAEGFERVIELFVEARKARKTIKEQLGNDVPLETSSDLENKINQMKVMINQFAEEQKKIAEVAQPKHGRFWQRLRHIAS